MAKITPNPAPKGGLNPAFKSQRDAGRTFFGTGRTNAQNQPAKAPTSSTPTASDTVRQHRQVRAVETKDLVGTSGGYKLGSSRVIQAGTTPTRPEKKISVGSGARPDPLPLTKTQKNSARKQALSKNTVTFTRREGSK